MKSTAPWSGLRGPVTCDLPRWPRSPPRPRSLSPCAPATWAFCLLPCFLLTTCTCSFFCLEYSLLYTPSGGGRLLLKFQILVQTPLPQKGLLWPPGPSLSHIPAGIPVWICVYLFGCFSSTSFPFLGQGPSDLFTSVSLCQRAKWF